MSTIKIINIISLLLLFCLGHGQSKDIVYIEYNSNLDQIKYDEKHEVREIWLKNYLYEKELKEYNEFIARRKQDKILKENSILPSKPGKFYQLNLNDSLKVRSGKIETLVFFDRGKLLSLDSYNKIVYIVMKRNKEYIYYPVLFYHNPVE